MGGTLIVRPVCPHFSGHTCRSPRLLQLRPCVLSERQRQKTQQLTRSARQGSGTETAADTGSGSETAPAPAQRAQHEVPRLALHRAVGVNRCEQV